MISPADQELCSEVLIRPVERDELPQLLHLYTHLHTADSPLPDKVAVNAVWHAILQDPKLHCLVAVVDRVLVASCILVIVPNLTRGARPYGVLENVVTHAAYRRRGIGTHLLKHALQLAWETDCYKVMLMTGRKEDSVLRFYEQAGFKRGVKTGLVATPDG